MRFFFYSSESRCQPNAHSVFSRIVIKLFKADAEKEWTDLDSGKDRKEEARKERIKDKSTTEELLKDMFDNCDEEAQLGLRKALHEGQAKRKAKAET